MQASNRPHEEKPPNVLLVVLASLFGYPGAGHLMVGKKRSAAIFALAFTASTLAMVVEALPFVISWVKQLTAAINDGVAPELASINLPRLALWTVLSLVLWVASAVQAGKLAQRLAQQMNHVQKASSDPVPESQTATHLDAFEVEPEPRASAVDTGLNEKSPE